MSFFFGSASGELGGDDLVHDRDVGFDAEEGFVQFYRTGGLSFGVGDRDRDHQALTFFLAALRTVTTPFLAPGTAPFTRIAPFSVSTFTMVRFCWVVR